MKWTYLVTRLIRRQVSAPLFYWLMTHSRSSVTAETRPDQTFHPLLDRLRSLDLDLAGQHVLELGSGRYARIGLRLLGAGASRVTLVDPCAMPVTNPRHRRLLEHDCASLGLDITHALNSIHVLAHDFLTTSPGAPQDRAHVIVSTATLEHVQDPLAIFEKGWEWLRPGGFMSHVVDLRDHLFSTPFQMLTFSDRTWDRWLDPKGGFHLNRWRLHEYLEAMHKTGLVHVDYQPLQQDKIGLMEIWPSLDKRFRSMDPDLLAILVVHLSAQKPVS